MHATKGSLAGFLLLSLGATACSSEASGAATGGSDGGTNAADTSVDDVSTDAPADAADAGPPQAYLRVAQLSPDAPSADLCVAPHGTTSFQGPLLAQLSSPDAGADAAAVGLAYAQVSAYLALAPGPYDVRLVVAGAADCSADASAFVPDVTELPSLAQNAYVTLLLAGEQQPTSGDHGFTAVALMDDATLDAGAAAMRAVNAMPSAPLLDFGIGSLDAGWTPLFTDVGFAAPAHAAPSAGALDPNGYLPMAPLAGQPFSARASTGATGDLASAENVSLAFGAIATLFAIGKPGDAVHPAALLLCTDNSPTGGIVSDCAIQQ